MCISRELLDSQVSRADAVVSSRAGVERNSCVGEEHEEVPSSTEVTFNPRVDSLSFAG